MISESVYLTNVRIHLCQHHVYVYKTIPIQGPRLFYALIFFKVIYMFVFFTNKRVVNDMN